MGVEVQGADKIEVSGFVRVEGGDAEGSRWRTRGG